MKPKHQRLLLIIAGMLCLAGGVTLILYNFRTNMVFFYSPTELHSQAIATDKNIRIGGLIKAGSIVKQEKLVTEFVITDMAQEITVRYTGLLPALFREGQGMVAKGRLDSGKVFIAEELLAKHDENYMPKEVADALKKSGQWRPDGAAKP